MKTDAENLQDNKELKKLRRQVWIEAFLRSLGIGLFKWIGAIITTPVVVGFTAVLAKVCYYVALWAWHLF